MTTNRIRHVLVLACIGLSACSSGTRLVKHSEPTPALAALAANGDAKVKVTLDWVLVRNAPGAWAKNADWDEYLLTVQNSSQEPVQVTSVSVFDSLQTRLQPGADRESLVKASKQTVRRYRGQKIDVKAGMGSTGLVASGLAAGVAGYGLAYGAAMGSLMSGGAAAGGAAATAGAFLLAAPAFGIVGIVRAVRNGQVNSEIERRQSRLPLAIGAGQSGKLDLFFPLGPAPSRVELNYLDAAGEHVVTIDTTAALAGLHLGGKSDEPAGSAAVGSR